MRFSSMATLARPRPPVLSLIGNTALIPLHFPEVDRTLYAKAEFLNPSGSIKDRLALCIVEDAESGACSTTTPPSSNARAATPVFPSPWSAPPRATASISS